MNKVVYMKNAYNLYVFGRSAAKGRFEHVEKMGGVYETAG